MLECAGSKARTGLVTAIAIWISTQTAISGLKAVMCILANQVRMCNFIVFPNDGLLVSNGISLLLMVSDHQPIPDLVSASVRDRAHRKFMKAPFVYQSPSDTVNLVTYLSAPNVHS